MESRDTLKKSKKKLKLNMLQGEQPELLDKQAAKMVEQVRLQLIETENRSAGALLDTRTLHVLDEPNVKIGNATQNKLDSQKRVESRRNARVQEEVKKESESAIKNMRVKGIEIVKTSNYENEELIWATKSSDPNYSKKRRFDNPALQKFKNNLTAEERKLFKSLCHDALVDLSNRYREEVEKIRSDMDLAGIFHPEANAHRAHCMYLMKLYNGIRADTIEDPVLRKMEHDIEVRKKQQEAEERRQRELISNFENKQSSKKEKRSVAETMALAQAEEESKLKADEARQMEELEKHRLKQEKEAKLKSNMNKTSTQTLKKNKSAPVILQPLKNLPNKTPTAKTSVNPASSNSPKSKEDKDMNDEASVSTELSDTHDKKSSNNDAKLFSKIKRGKMGGADPRTVLLSEASRLDEAEVLDVKKVKERSSLVDDKTTAWMLQLLQESQIQKTAEGRDLAPAVQGLLPSDTFGTTMDSPMKKTHSKEDPQRVVPFNDFYEMFKSFTEEAPISTETSQVPQPKQTLAIEVRGLSTAVVSDADDVSNNISATKVEKFEPTDTVKSLAEVDPQFEAYVKMMRRQSPGGQRLFRSKTGSQTKRRPHNPLGQKAVNMTDICGIPTADSKKGFTNIFNTNTADDDSSEEEVEIMSKYMNSTQIDEDDMSHDHAGDGMLTNNAAVTVAANQDKPALADVIGKVGITTMQLGGSGRTTPNSPTRSRSRRTRSRENANRNKGVGQEVNEGKDMQSKLMAVFDCLQTPADSRLAYMRKYAQPDRAISFNRAIDVLAEGAVFAIAREQLVHRNVVKLREGYAVLPLLASGLLSDFMENMPTLLSSRAPALCIQTNYAQSLRDPASVSALQHINRIVHSIFPDDRVEDQSDNAMTPETAAELLLDLETNIEQSLEKLRLNLLTDFDDQFQIQGIALTEWLASLKAKAKKQKA